MAVAVSLLASVITFAFAGTVLWQYARRRRVYRLAWALALVAYGVATSAQFTAEIGGWSTGAFRVWYLSGGLLTAAYLGQGTAFLLLPRRLTSVLFVLLLLVSAIGAWRIATIGLDAAAILPAPHRFTPRATSLPADLRALAVLLNVYGTLLLVGGAIWSARDFADHMLDRRRRGGHRFLSNLLIAAGAVIVAAAGSFEALGREEFLYAGEILGISIIFAGFLRSREQLSMPLRRYFTRPERPGVAQVTSRRSLPDHVFAGTQAATPDDGADLSVQRLKRISDRRPAPRH